MKNWLVITTTLLIAIGMGQAQAAGDARPARPRRRSVRRVMVQTATALNPEWPKLAGQHEGYLVKQL